MTNHPLTDGICMRAAADWQLEQVNEWIDKNVHNYIDPDNLWTCEILYKLQDDLNKAMRPQEDS